MAARAIVNKLLDKRADHIYCDIRGQLTNENDPHIFDAELLPGEQIMREFRVHTVTKGRSTFEIVVRSILTLGMYYIYLMFCSCCRHKSMGNRRARVAFTNKGRALMWSADIVGSESAGLAPTTTYYSNTDICAFHVKDINGMQVVAGRYPKFYCFPCCGENHTARLRLFVGSKYPSATKITEHGAHMESATLFGTSKVDWARAGFLSGSGVEGSNVESGCDGFLYMLANCGSGLYNWATCGCYYTPEVAPMTLGGKGTMSIDILTSKEGKWYDGYHDDFGSAWTELAQIMSYVLQCKSEKSPLDAVSTNDEGFVLEQCQNVDDARDSLLVEGTLVRVNTLKTPLGPDERVVDALPILPRMSWYECCCVPYICCRRKYKTKAAIIATTDRIMSCSEYRPPKPGPDYEFYMMAYFIGDLGGGFMIEDPKGTLGYTMDVKTKFGALRIEPQLSRQWPWNAKVDAFIRPRMFAFLRTLENACKVKQAIPAPMKGTLPNQDDVNKAMAHINLWQGEELCSVITSENLYRVTEFMSNPVCKVLSWGDPVCVVGLLRVFTCGARPFRLDQVLALTTHRVISFQTIGNSCGTGGCCGRDQKMLMWFPLQKVEAIRTRGSVLSRPSTKCDRILAKCLPCCNKDTASVSVDMGLAANFGKIPFGARKLQGRAKEGLMESNPELEHFRAAFAFYLSSAGVNDKAASAKPLVLNNAYGQAPYPEYLKDEEIKNPV